MVADVGFTPHLLLTIVSNWKCDRLEKKQSAMDSEPTKLIKLNEI